MTMYNNPVNVEFGQNSINFLPRFINGRRALLITSLGFEKRGYIASLREQNPSIIEVINSVRPNPTIEDVLKFRQIVSYDTIDVIVALGGGSVIDIAKALSVHSLPEKKSIQDVIINGFEGVTFKTKPIIAIPTTAGTGSEVTMWGTIWDEKNKLKYSISHPNLYCEVAILDPILQITLPKSLTVQTGLDAFSHSLEALWNNNANSVSDEYAVDALKTIIMTLPLLKNDLSNVRLREQMLLASYRSGLAFSNTQTALAHAMSYYMTLNKGIPHGIAASFTLPAIVKVAMEKPEISQKLTRAFGNNPVETILDLLSNLEVSVNPNDYELTQEDWSKILRSLGTTTRAKNSTVNANKVVALLMKSE